MFATLALGLVLASAPRCVEVEIVALGRSAHGSSIMPEAAPHLLIKALDRLPGWVESSASITAARIASLEAAPAVNVIPRRAEATIDISFDDETLDLEALIADLGEVLGSRVEIEMLATPCRPLPQP